MTEWGGQAGWVSEKGGEHSYRCKSARDIGDIEPVIRCKAGC